MERRDNARYRVWFPVTVETEDGQTGTAITYDVSASGLLMACPGRVAVGSHVTLRFKLGDDATERVLGAQVNRVDENPGDDGPWRFRMAVAFDAAQPELAGLLEDEADAPGE